MTDYAQPRQEAWEPPQLVRPEDRAGHLGANVINLRTGEIRKEPARPHVAHGSGNWLGTQIHDCVEPGHSIRSIMSSGRELVAEHVMRIRALHRGKALRAELRWDGPELLVGAQLIKLADAQRQLLELEGEQARTLRFRIRVQAMTLENTLMAYAATELVDPRIMDSMLSLDVLCHADFEMPPEVIIRLGLARAYQDEIENEHPNATFQGDDMWPLVNDAWSRNMAFARGVAKKWAEDVVATGRAGYAASHFNARL